MKNYIEVADLVSAYMEGGTALCPIPEDIFLTRVPGFAPLPSPNVVLSTWRFIDHKSYNFDVNAWIYKWLDAIYVRGINMEELSNSLPISNTDVRTTSLPVYSLTL